MRFIKGISCFSYIFDAFIFDKIGFKVLLVSEFRMNFNSFQHSLCCEIVMNFVGKSNQTNQPCFYLLRKKNFNLDGNTLLFTFCSVDF